MKTAKQIEKHFKGVSNHHRINILLLIHKNSNITLDQISTQLNANFKTISEYTRRLAHASLLTKKYRGKSVLHSLSPYGEKIIKFIKSF